MSLSFTATGVPKLRKLTINGGEYTAIGVANQKIADFTANNTFYAGSMITLSPDKTAGFSGCWYYYNGTETLLLALTSEVAVGTGYVLDTAYFGGGNPIDVSVMSAYSASPASVLG